MKNLQVFRKEKCRVCFSVNLVQVINLGSTPLANAFLKKTEIDNPESYYPLEVNFCRDCTFIQLGHVVDPKLLFSNYVYVSSTSPVFIKHFEDFSKHAIEKFGLVKNNLIIDIGSNDGILLKPFKDAGFKVLGIEPAKKIAKEANKRGIKTISNFIDQRLAKNIHKKYGKANLITATNVFAHIDDLDEVVKSVDQMLDKNGIFMIEVAYLIDFIEKKYFDLIYHEHVSYWRVETFVKFFEKRRMRVIAAEKVPVHGGSIRIFVAKNDSEHKAESSVKEFIKKERDINLQKESIYVKYADEIERNKILLLNLIYKLKKSGKKIAGYGAPAKGNTLLNYFSIGTETLEYIIDDSVWKQDLFSPGKKIPVKDFSELNKNKVDYLLILAWNFAESIIEKNKDFASYGGKFIVPVPKPKVI